MGRWDDACQYVDNSEKIRSLIATNMRRPQEGTVHVGEYVLDLYGNYAYRVAQVNKRGGEIVSVSVFPAFPGWEVTDRDRRVLKTWQFRIIDQGIFKQIVGLMLQGASLRMKWCMIEANTSREHVNYRSRFMDEIILASYHRDIARFMATGKHWQFTPCGIKPMRVVVGDDDTWQLDLSEYGRGARTITSARALRFIARVGRNANVGFFGLQCIDDIGGQNEC
jgi:hypothetical protein